MGSLLARAAEEKAELNAGKIRAARFLARSSPSYIEDMDVLGLDASAAPDDASTVYDGDVTETGTQAESASQAGDDTRSEAGESTTGGGSDEGSAVSRAKSQRSANDPRVRAKMRVANDYKLLLSAASKGGIGGLWKVRYLLRKPNVRADHRDNKGRSAMYIAAERGHPSIIEALLQNRGKVDNPTNAKWTPLHAAAFHGQMKCMETLMAASASVNARDMHGCTPLILAASSPKLFIVDLVSAGDRKKRKKFRKGAVQKQNKIDAGKSGKNKGQITDPFTMWKFFPNRIELIAINILLKEPLLQIDLADNMKRTALTYAARYGRTYAISRLLHAKANPKHSDGNGRTPLFHAAANGHNEAVEMFLRVGASPNVTDQYFASPLHIVLQNGDDTLANTLISSEASVNAIDCEGRTPIMIAMDTGNHMMFGALVERRSNLDVKDIRGWNVIMYAVETDMLGEVLPLLSRSGERVKGILRLYDPQGRNSLHHAAFHPNIQQATQALTALIKLDAVAAQIGDCNGDTAVHMAAELGRLEMLRAMGEWLGPLDFANHRGETPLMYAAHGGHMASVIALLEDKGKGPLADGSKIDLEGKSVLMHACSSGRLDLVNLILQNREGRHPDLKFPPLDVNQADKHGTTALHVAASEGFWQLLPSLVLAGSNKAAKDNDGCTALHAAAIEDEVLAVATLIDIGLDPNAGDNQGWTPLMHAAWKGADDVVRLLVDAGANLDARNCDGDTALQITLRRKDGLMKRTRDILTDGLLDSDFYTTHSVDARGHMMVTVVKAHDLYQEGKADQINSYVYLELCTSKGTAPMVGYTTCVLTEASPQWHEVFSFDVERIDPSAYLIAWVVSAPGDDFHDIVEGATYGLTEEQMQEVAMKRAVAGEEAPPFKPDFNKALGRMLKRQGHFHNRHDDADVLKKSQLASMPNQPALSTYQRHEIPILERRWNDVMNLRQLLQKTGCDIMEPLIPRTHMPLGCIVARFRHLRGSIWGVEPVVMDRKLRLNAKGSMHIELDFRPRYFNAVDPLAKQRQEDEFQPRTPRADDLEETAETAALSAQEGIAIERMNDLILTGAGGENIRGGREAMQQNPVEMYQKYEQVSKWAEQVIKTRKRIADEEFRTADPDATGGMSWITEKVKSYQRQYQAHKEKKEKTKEMLDVRVQAVVQPPAGLSIAKATTTTKPQPGQPKTAFNAIPQLRVEPWLEDILAGSRFV